MSRKTVALVAAFTFSALGGCAPDAWNNVQASGYNAFLNKIATECYPLQMGRSQMSRMITENAIGDTDAYNYFLDQTSRLYYGGLSAAQYTSSLNGFFEGGATNAVGCIVPKLPQNR